MDKLYITKIRPMPGTVFDASNGKRYRIITSTYGCKYIDAKGKTIQCAFFNNGQCGAAGMLDCLPTLIIIDGKAMKSSGVMAIEINKK